MATVAGRQGRSPRRKLPARFHGIVLPLVLSVLMSCIVSGVATLHATGLAGGFLGRWMGAWRASWLIAFPTLLAVLPVVRRIVGWIVESPANPTPGAGLPAAAQGADSCRPPSNHAA